MNDLTATHPQLPTKAEDLARFILVGREKLTSVRAEIRAIDKLQLAEGVREQKRVEAQMLAEALLDAEVRIGELFKQMPKSVGGRPEKTKPNSGHSFETETKAQATERLGFDRHQVQRLETLASHPDLVEQVKAEARENDDLPTRTAVLNLAKAREEKRQSEYAQIDTDCALSQALTKALGFIDRLPRDDESYRAMYRGEIAPSDTLFDLSRAIEKLERVRTIYRRGGK